MLNKITENFRFYSSFVNKELIAIYIGACSKSNISLSDHLDAAANWICQAQDATADDGVARSYSFIYQPWFKRKGWFPSYPETTGYIIPTMFDYARLRQRQDIHSRALRMATWETNIQMGNGAVQGGTVDYEQTPAIFNTGQVIFGWLRAYQETGNEQFIQSAIRAGEFLLANQDNDGSWRKNLSDYTASTMPFYTYNTRTAWALYLLGKETINNNFIDAACEKIDFALKQQKRNGWFYNNCLNKPEQPLLHTIAYCIRGILEIGVISNNDQFIQCAKKAADELLVNIRYDGSLSGRFDSDWKPSVEWSCLTGDAQLSIIYGRLYQTYNDKKYLVAMKKINTYLMKKQLLCPLLKNAHGGICGSSPVHAEYGKFSILNWAVKFFMDALMLEQSLA